MDGKDSLVDDVLKECREKIKLQTAVIKLRTRSGNALIIAAVNIVVEDNAHDHKLEGNV